MALRIRAAIQELNPGPLPKARFCREALSTGFRHRTKLKGLRLHSIPRGHPAAWIFGFVFEKKRIPLRVGQRSRHGRTRALDQCFIRAQAPDASRPVVGRGEHPRAIGRESRTSDVSIVDSQRRELTCAIGVPEAHRAVLGCCENPCAIRREGGAPDRSRMSAEDVQFPAVSDCPQASRPVLRCRQHLRAIVRKDGGTDRRLMAP
jgi:hypothetical protein